MSNAKDEAAIHHVLRELAQRWQDDFGIQITDVKFTWTDATSLRSSNHGIVVGVSMSTRIGIAS